MYFESKTKQYLLIIALAEVINMAIYSMVGPNICQVSVYV